MDQSAHRLIAICFVIFASASLNAASRAEGKSNAAIASVGTMAAITYLEPFTHTAYIPAGADLSSIKFESIEAVKVATVGVSAADKRYCAAGSPEPGGSLYCPYVRDEAPMPAYRVTYSFRGPAMASDEYGGTRFTFSVNLRPEDLGPAIREALSERKMSRAAAAKLFAFTPSRDLVSRVAIDEPSSAFCEGRYTDGAWTQTESNCKEKVTYKTVRAPSGYIAVRVDPAPVR